MNAARLDRFHNAAGKDLRIPHLSLTGNYPDVMIGSRIGHIRVTGVLGQGGMGDVYRGIDERLDRPVALKVIRAERRLSLEARGRFLREARTLSSLDHPNICRIHEYIESEDGDFLVLELVEGMTIERAIEVGLSRARKLRIAIEIADALAAAHRKGIVHRDLKPENVMLTRDGVAKVLDFGIARQHADEEPAAAPPPPDTVDEAETLIFTVGDATLAPSDRLPSPVTALGMAVGTPAFMSPEQAQGKVATPASDMYSFGLVLQTLFMEVEPHPMDLGASELMIRSAAGVSDPMAGQARDVTALVERLKSIAPADRPTAIEALSILGRIVDAPRRRTRFAVLAFVALVLIASAIRYVVDVTEARRDAERRRRQAEELVSFMVGDLRTKLEAVGRLDVLDGAASRALDYFASLSPEELNDGDLHKNALALAQLGEVRLNEGKLDAAVKMFTESVRFASAATERNPKQEEWQLALSNGHFWLGEALRQRGDTAGTLRHFREYLEISKRLAAAHPGNAKYEAEVSYGHGNVGAAYEAAGDAHGALAEYRRALEIDRRRLAGTPRDEKTQEDLAISLNRVGVIRQSLGDVRDAARMYDEERALRRRLLAAAPDDARRVNGLAISCAYTGTLQQMTGDRKAALASFREELALSKQLSDRDPANLSMRRNRAIAQSRVAVLMIDELQTALKLNDAAIAELRDIVRVDRRPGWRRDLASSIQRGGSLRLAAADARGALDAAQEALAIIEPVAKEEPQNAGTARTFAEILLLAGDAEERRGAARAANAHRTRAAAIMSLQPQTDPRNGALRARALASLTPFPARSPR
jgi:eukaryotic-like serine/threonine-protein kinase